MAFVPYRTIAHEHLGIDPIVLELSLSHRMPGALGAVYARAQLLLTVYLFITGFKHEKKNGGYRLYPPPAPTRQGNDRAYSQQPPEQGALTHLCTRRYAFRRALRERFNWHNHHGQVVSVEGLYTGKPHAAKANVEGIVISRSKQALTAREGEEKQKKAGLVLTWRPCVLAVKTGIMPAIDPMPNSQLPQVKAFLQSKAGSFGDPIASKRRKSGMRAALCR